MKVLFVQYGAIKAGVISVKNSVDSVEALRRKMCQATGAFVMNFGYIPKFCKFSYKRTEEKGENGVGSRSAKAGRSTEDKERNETLSDSTPSSPDKDDADHSQKEDEDNDDTLRIKPLFFLDNIFT